MFFFLSRILFTGPNRAPQPPPPPPPPPEDKNSEAPITAEAEVQTELHFKLWGFQVELPKRPVMPNWLHAILDYRFPSSIDPFTSK